MRRVEVQKIKREVVDGLSRSTNVVDYIGTFLAFSTDYEELEQGVGNYPVMLVEKEDGTIGSASIEMVRFLND